MKTCICAPVPEDDITKSLKGLSPETVAKMIISALAGGLLAAAKIYRAYIQLGNDPMVLRRHCCVSPKVWSTLDDIAAGRLDPRILCLQPRIAMLLRYLPVETQTRALDEGVDFLKSDGTMTHMTLSEISTAAATQVIGPAGIRTKEEQQKWLTATKTTVLPVKEEPAYILVDGGITVPRRVHLTKQDLLRILMELG